MKTIFVPTDFSPSASNALNFAISLASKLKAQLVLFNAFRIQPPVAEVPYEVLAEEIEAKKQEVERKLILECNTIQKSGKIPFGSIPIEYITVEGAMPDALVDFLSSRHVDYVVMGTNLMGHHTTGMFGSTAARVMAQVQCPVIIIPPYAHIGPELKKLTFATNFHTSDIDAIAQLSKMAEAFSAQLNILHVYDREVQAKEQISSMDHFKTMVTNETNYTNISFQVLEAADVEKALKDYIISSGDADMIVMSTHIRSWIERVFEKSFTKQMALRSNVPMIIFHHQNEEMVSKLKN